MTDEELIEVWLEADEARSRPFRAKRLRKLVEILEIPDRGLLFFGGMETMQAFTELRLAYIHGLFLAVVLQVLLIIERNLAGHLYAKGIEEAKQMRLEKLLTSAVEHGYVTQDEARIFDRLRSIRNAYTHFRAPGHASSSLQRAIESDLPFHDLLEADATDSILALASFGNYNLESAGGPTHI